MAATAETFSSERSKGWYQKDLTEVNDPVRTLLEKYSKLPSEDIVTHVNTIVSFKISKVCETEITKTHYCRLWSMKDETLILRA